MTPDHRHTRQQGLRVDLRFLEVRLLPNHASQDVNATERCDRPLVRMVPKSQPNEGARGLLR
jgi:hypothetical protein